MHEPNFGTVSRTKTVRSRLMLITIEMVSMPFWRRRTKGADCGEVLVSRRLGGNVVQCVMARESGHGQRRSRTPLLGAELRRSVVPQVFLGAMAGSDLRRNDC